MEKEQLQMKQLQIKEDDLQEVFQKLKIKGKSIPSRTYHQSIIHDNHIYILGGKQKQVHNHWTQHQPQDNTIYRMKLDGLDRQGLYQWQKMELINTTNVYFDIDKLYLFSSIVREDKVYIYGGKNGLYNTNQFVEIDLEQLTINAIQYGPFCIDSHSAIYDQANDRMVVYGGFITGHNKNSHMYLGDLVVYDFKSNSWDILHKYDRQSRNPRPRSYCTLFIYKEYLYMFGGKDFSYYFNDLWRFDQNKGWKQIRFEEGCIPVQRKGHSHIFYEKKLIIFGGMFNIANENNEIYYLDMDGLKWNRIQTQFVHTNYNFNDNQSIDDNKNTNNKNRMSVEQLRNTADDQYKLSNEKQQLFDKSKSQLNSKKYDVLKTQFNSQLNNLQKSQSKEKKQTRQQFRPNKSVQLFSFPKMEAPKGFNPTVNKLKKIDTGVNVKLLSRKEKNKKVFLNQFKIDEKGVHKIEYNQNVSKKLPGIMKHQKQRQTISQNKSEEQEWKYQYIVPCAREGSSSTIYNDSMIIFGGDRYNMDYNDTFSIDLKEMFNRAHPM